MLHVASDRSVFLAMIIKEYRVVMPLSVEEYQVAQLYMVAKLSTQQTGVFASLELGHLPAQHFSHCLIYTSAAPSSLRTFAGGGEGVTVLVNEPFANHPELGSGQVIIHLSQYHYQMLSTYTAQYTKKIYHIASKLPGWLKAVLPTKATELHEEAWNASVPSLCILPVSCTSLTRDPGIRIVAQF